MRGIQIVLPHKQGTKIQTVKKMLFLFSLVSLQFVLQLENIINHYRYLRIHYLVQPKVSEMMMATMADKSLKQLESFVLLPEMVLEKQTSLEPTDVGFYS